MTTTAQLLVFSPGIADEGTIAQTNEDQHDFCTITQNVKSEHNAYATGQGGKCRIS